MKIEEKELEGFMINVVYHKNCLDGLFAASLMKILLEHKKLPFNMIPCQYGDTLDLGSFAVNFFVDFSLKREAMRNIIESSHRTYVLDHHKTALEELDTLSEEYPNFELFFDNDVSGTEVVYNTLFKDIETIDVNVRLIKHVTDWDLFKFKLPETKGIRASIEFLTNKKNLDKAYSLISHSNTDLDSLNEDGLLLNDFIWNNAQNISHKLGKNLPILKINSYEVIAINAVNSLSELGNTICMDHNKISLMYFIVENKVVCSLRSLDALPDASIIASFFGGGGHRNACGFELPLEQLQNFINNGFVNVIRFNCNYISDYKIKNGYFFITEQGRPLMYKFDNEVIHYKNMKHNVQIDYTNSIKLI